MTDATQKLIRELLDLVPLPLRSKAIDILSEIVENSINELKDIFRNKTS